jgi:hypothetical protein
VNLFALLGWAAVVYVTIRVAKAAWSSTPEGRARNREAMKGFMLRDRDPKGFMLKDRDDQLHLR